VKVSNDILEKLRKYSNNELSKDERISFEATLLKHPELQEELEFTKSLIKSTEKLEHERILNLLKELDVRSNKDDSIESIQKETNGLSKLFSPQRALFWLIIVALILAIISMLWHIQKLGSSQQEETLQKFQVTAYIPLSQSDLLRGDNKSNFLSFAFREYEMGNYEESLNIIENFSNEDSLYRKSLFIQGHCLYKLKEYDRAIKTFNELQNLSTQYPKSLNPNSDNVGWTKILAILGKYKKEGSPNKSKLEQTIRKYISDSNPKDSYYQFATELLRILE